MLAGAGPARSGGGGLRDRGQLEAQSGQFLWSKSCAESNFYAKEFGQPDSIAMGIMATPTKEASAARKGAYEVTEASQRTLKISRPYLGVVASVT